jgi:bacteriocin-like protein
MNNFETISTTTLASVTGGTSSSKDTQLTAMLTDISKSIKDAADAKNKGQDPTQLMMMMMMGGMGGGGGSTQVAAAPPPPAPSPAVVRVNVR